MKNPGPWTILILLFVLVTASTAPGTARADGLIQPDDLEYRGAFRLPDRAGECDWTYSGQAMTYYPGGDPQGPDDGYPGSIFATGNDAVCQHVSEISIPAPVLSRDKDPADLNRAAVLQDFQDIHKGMFGDFQGLTLPRAGLEYLPAQGRQKRGRLHFCLAQHIQDFDASHGWCEVDLSHPRPAGPWKMGPYTNYVTNDYLFEIPRAWSDKNTPGLRLATGRAREGLWSGRGPALFAYGPWKEGNPPAPDATLRAVTPLLLYGRQTPGNPDIVSSEATAIKGYSDADHWYGGAWLTAKGKAAVIFSGTKAMGNSWYGYANGVVHPHDCYTPETPPCPEPPGHPYSDRGFWADGYRARIIFYNPDDLAAVARGEMETWAPQPYASMDVDEHLFDPYNPGTFERDLVRYKRDYVGATCFDRERGLLYIMERQAEGEKSLVHVWKIR